MKKLNPDDLQYLLSRVQRLEDALTPTKRPKFKRKSTRVATIRLDEEIYKAGSAFAKARPEYSGGSFSALVERLVWEYALNKDNSFIDTDDTE